MTFRRTLALVLLTVLAGAPTLSMAAKLTYLSCDLAGADASGPPRHFDFTLDEAAGTVSFVVKEKNATNVEKAVFGADSVTWTNDLGLVVLTRTISRSDLSIVEETVIGGDKTVNRGTCSLTKPKARKF